MENKELYIKRLVAQGMTEDEAEQFINLIVAEAQRTSAICHIKVSYKTGDSFHRYYTSEIINYNWHNISIVQENIRRLRKQVEFYNKLSGWYTDAEREQIALEWAAEPWAVVTDKRDYCTYKLSDGRHINEWSVKLLKDDGTEFQISTWGWEGYFEGEQTFDIITVENEN